MNVTLYGTVHNNTEFFTLVPCRKFSFKQFNPCCHCISSHHYVGQEKLPSLKKNSYLVHTCSEPFFNYFGGLQFSFSFFNSSEYCIFLTGDYSICKFLKQFFFANIASSVLVFKL